MSSDIHTLHRGSSPLLLSLPHAGREIASEVRPDLVERALAVEDTDWHLDRLYDFAQELGASVIVPRHSRYVIDLNRPPEDAPMYPGANNTELCPTRFFSGAPLYRSGREPDAAEVARRRERYWRPYHAALQAELDRIRAVHGHALLFDGHSIRSELPWLFEGRLPDLNLGTASGTSCASDLRDALAAVLAGSEKYSHVVDGRFKGGYITRHYGRPAGNVHAVQLEMCWSCYMADEQSPERWDAAQGDGVRPLLRRLLETATAWRAS
jgi:N-formylglutamate deformylase